MNKVELEKKIKMLDGLTNEEKSALVELLHNQKKYGLVWEDKPENVETRLQKELPVLTEVKKRAIISDDKNAPNHILIEGDNLEALTALTYTHAGKIDVIYIDPPYNTGNKDFIYNDSIVDSEDSYKHSKWLSFMNKRLKIAKKLLCDKGVIFISIDDNELANLRLLGDEIFGFTNYQATITYVRKTSGKQDSSNFAKSTEYILIYTKTTQWIASNLPADEKVTDRYNKIDETGRRYREGDLRKTGNSDRRIDRPLMYYPFYLNPLTKELLVRNNKDEMLLSRGFIEIYPIKSDGTDGRWRWASSTSSDNIINLVAKEMPKYKGKYTVYEKDYIDKKEEERTVKEHTFWDRKPFNSDNAILDFKELGFGNQDFPFPKSTDLIQHIIFLSNNKNGIYLDFFAGSGTTLQALIRQNSNDDGHRQCILVTNNENNICENVTYERNKRVIQGYINPKGEEVAGLTSNNLRYYKTDFISRKRTIKNMRALVAASTDLLCIKNNIYTEQQTFDGRKLKPEVARYFDNGMTKMLVIYNELAVYAFATMLRTMDIEGKIKVYVFSNNRYAYNDNFEEVLNKVELCALPAAIYDAYNAVLKPMKKDDNDNAVLFEGENDVEVTNEQGGEQ